MLPKTREEQLKLLLELKKKKDGELDVNMRKELDALNALHKEYAAFNAEEMEASMQNSAKGLSLSYQSASDIELIIQDYKTQFSKNPGYKEPVTRDGITSLSFESEEEAIQFSMEQASKGRKFKILDSQHRLVAYSDGKGQLLHADGQPFKPGDSFFSPTNTDTDKFKQTIAPPVQPSPTIPRPNPPVK